jgi:hypothetical protein
VPVGKDHGKNVEGSREHPQQISQVRAGFGFIGIMIILLRNSISFPRGIKYRNVLIY